MMNLPTLDRPDGDPPKLEGQSLGGPARSVPRSTPARMAPLAKLPVFLDLQGRRVLLCGGGEPAVWKAELLAAAGAQLAVLCAEPHEELVALADRHPGRVRIERRAWTEHDLDGATLVVAELDDPDEAAALTAATTARGLLLNVIDKPEHCAFQFGTVVNRSPVVIGIMTDGTAPILGQALRRRIEAILPAGLSGWAAAAGAFRTRLKALLPGRSDRRAFWERFVDHALAAPAPGDDATAALERLAQGVDRDRSGPSGMGQVVIVGGGPGDPELLTLKAMRELQAADVIVYDRLVTPGVLELARREARRIHVGKEGHGAACRQEDISSLLVELALAGERVVRLKGGDPAIFARTGEEVAACRQAGVPVRVVPGVTTASAAAASLSLSLTHRDHAQRVQFVTGHDRTGRLPPDLDFGALADPKATLVVYMGRRTAALLADKLMAHGLPADTPVVAVADASRPDEAVVRLTVGSLVEGVDLPDRRPVIILIGASLGDGAPEGVRAAAIDRYASAAG